MCLAPRTHCDLDLEFKNKRLGRNTHRARRNKLRGRTKLVPRKRLAQNLRHIRHLSRERKNLGASRFANLAPRINSQPLLVAFSGSVGDGHPEPRVFGGRGCAKVYCEAGFQQKRPQKRSGSRPAAFLVFLARATRTRIVAPHLGAAAYDLLHRLHIARSGHARLFQLAALAALEGFLNFID
jgi:hypothetical protein